MTNKSSGLHKYLNDRYADTVVLSFIQIEDLSGTPLPEAARRSPAWWTTPDAEDAASRFADSWLHANRTARPNLLAGNVTFLRGA
jgi:hypothetical protein